MLLKYNYNYQRIYSFINTYFRSIIKKTDSKFLTTLNSQKNIIIDSLKCNRLNKHLSKQQIENHYKYMKEKYIYKKYYILEYYTEEVFYYHHGLRFASDDIKEYIRNKDIIDVGSFIGDSLLILLNYTKKVIHLYEISDKNLRILKKNIRKNRIEPNRVIIRKIGLSNKTGTINLVDKGNGGVGIGIGKGKTIITNITTLDNEFNDCKCEIGFIKVDIEGQGYNFILGAKETILKHRPVLSLAIYHNYDEFFLSRNVLEAFVKNYTYEYYQVNNCEPWACDFILFAYPSEIIA